MKTDQIHIGNLIKQKIEQSSLTVAEFARLINRSRGAVYHIFECASIDIELLRTISDALDYDFIENHYVKTNSVNTDAKYALITFLSETEFPNDLPENSILVKPVKK